MAALLAPLACLGLAAAAAPQCRCRPSEPCWPSRSAWAELNSTVGGRLLGQLASPIAACDVDAAGTQCAEALAASQDPFWLQSQVMGTEKTGWLGAFDMRDKVSEFAVAAESTEDVAAAVGFAAKNNLRLAVKGTGHDYTGRSTANESLMVWTHNIAGIDFGSDFRPAGCPASQAAEPHVVHIGAGERWVDVYTKGLEQPTPL